MRLIIDIEGNDNVVSVIGDNEKPVIICESIRRMASQVVVSSELLSGEEFDSVYFADVLYLDSDLMTSASLGKLAKRLPP